ncbi:MAG TPA: glycosyltransferase family 4 protein, partial [Stellaceae bacterium]|nr:glycosyltransferase family 4 protein [Stellaceae bacterium]
RAHPHLAEAFDLAEPRGLARYLCWFCVVAVPHYGIAALVSRSLVAAVFEPDEGTPPLGHRRPSRLERFVWDSAPALQSRFDLATAEGQDGFVHWFAERGAAASGLGWLFAEAVPLSPAVPRRGALAPGGVNLIGFAYGQLGVGEDMRMLATACGAAEIPFCVVARTPIGERGPEDRLLAPRAVPAPVYDTSILCMTGLDTGLQLLERPSLLDDGAYRIGYWPWELPHWPGEWQCAFGLVDEVWASSRYTLAAYEEATLLPLRQMPLAVSVDRIVMRSRAAFGLPEDRLLFLYVFDGHSYIARKNPEAVVAAFRQAFPTGSEPVGLVLKMMGGDRTDPRETALFASIAEDPRIMVIDGVIPRGEVLGLIAACDIYVSLHRAEGFGRTIAEAMLLRRPVIATGFSGSDELVGPETALPVAWGRRAVGPDEYPFGDGQWWADPDIDHAAWCLRRLADSPSARARLAESAYRHVSGRHAPALVGARYAARLAEIARNRIGG